MEKFLYKKIYNILKNKIINSELKKGEKIPSIRLLMSKYNASSKTVIKSIELLEANGYVNTIPSKGSFVKENINYEPNKKIKSILKSYYDIEILSKELIDFAKSEVGGTYFNKELYKKLLRDTLESNDFDFNSTNFMEGLYSLRNLLADWLEEDNIFVNQENIVITSSAQQCLSIILRTIYVDKKINIAISNPTHFDTINLFEPFAHIKGVHLLDDGWDFDDFEEILKQDKIHFVYETPNFQNPSGISWSIDKKLHLLELAKKYDFYIIEEDNISDFYYNNKKPYSFKSLDRIGSERVFYIRDFSKIISQELQVSFIIFPPKFKDKILIEKVNIGSYPSNLSQKITELFIKDGYMKHFMGMMSKKLKIRHNYIIFLLEKIKEIKIMHSPNGGFFIWVQLKIKIDEDLFYDLCKKNGLLILPGYIFYQDYRKNSKFRICFLSTNLQQIKKGISIISEIIKNL